MVDKSLSSYSLSDDDIKHILKGKTNIISYSDLHKYRSLDDLLRPYGTAVILYETKKDSGHWVALIKQPNNVVEFFDSYGFKPDSELKWVPKELKEGLNEDHTYLIRLLLGSGYKVEYNHHQLQSKAIGHSECGRHVATRILLKDIPIDSYAKFLKSGGYKMKPDKVVTIVTNELLNK